MIPKPIMVEAVARSVVEGDREDQKRRPVPGGRCAFRLLAGQEGVQVR
jgi:hypothetical protein